MLKFLKVRDVKSPTRGTKTSSGIDFYIPENLKGEDLKYTPTNAKFIPDGKVQLKDWEIHIPWGTWVLIPSWLKVVLEGGNDYETYDLVLIGKSWVSIKTNLLVWASVIDNDYRWEFNFHLINPWVNEVVIKLWDKIIQWIIRKVSLDSLVEIDTEEFEKYNSTERWAGWFWSTWN